MNISIGNLIRISNIIDVSDFYVNFTLAQFERCTKFESQIYASKQKAKDVCRSSSECLGIENNECRYLYGSAHGCNEILNENCVKKKGKLGCRFFKSSL